MQTARSPQAEPIAAAHRLLSIIATLPTPHETSTSLDYAMRLLLAHGGADLPLPGSGRTLERWRALAAIAATDLSLAKIYESHTDALAILAEFGQPPHRGLWAVWAAESANERVILRRNDQGCFVDGVKPWCSGASIVDHGLVTVWTEDGHPYLAHITMDHRGIEIDESGWQAVGMAATASARLTFHHVPATPVGEENEYLHRPGFWQGAAGIAAVWYGAAAAIGRHLASSARCEKNPHAAAHLGAVDATLSAARALLVESAAWIDAHPAENASTVALRLRAAVETAAEETLRHTGRALGPAPLCRDAAHARRCADLPVFLRQSHAESDLATLGRAIAGLPDPWIL